ncbi:hypothetical protein ACJBU6_04190 [Exserohilum turcicum]
MGGGDGGGGETIADHILKSFQLPDVVPSPTSSKPLINLLRGHVLSSPHLHHPPCLRLIARSRPASPAPP